MEVSNAAVGRPAQALLAQQCWASKGLGPGRAGTSQPCGVLPPPVHVGSPSPVGLVVGLVVARNVARNVSPRWEPPAAPTQGGDPLPGSCRKEEAEEAEFCRGNVGKNVARPKWRDGRREGRRDGGEFSRRFRTERKQ